VSSKLPNNINFWHWVNVCYLPLKGLFLFTFSSSYMPSIPQNPISLKRTSESWNNKKPTPPPFNLTLSNNNRKKKSNKHTKTHTYIHTYIDKYKHPPINTFCKATLFLCIWGGWGRKGGNKKIVFLFTFLYVILHTLFLTLLSWGFCHYWVWHKKEKKRQKERKREKWYPST
jgi:hypothetical protein